MELQKPDHQLTHGYSNAREAQSGPSRGSHHLLRAGLAAVLHFVGWRFAFEKVVPVQLIYLVLFSASFFWKGFTGLAITIGAILTLFAVMQLTGRLDWSETFARLTAPARRLSVAPDPDAVR
jgi:hypothetical protein